MPEGHRISIRRTAPEEPSPNWTVLSRSSIRSPRPSLRCSTARPRQLRRVRARLDRRDSISCRSGSGRASGSSQRPSCGAERRARRYASRSRRCVHRDRSRRTRLRDASAGSPIFSMRNVPSCSLRKSRFGSRDFRLENNSVLSCTSEDATKMSFHPSLSKSNTPVLHPLCGRLDAPTRLRYVTSENSPLPSFRNSGNVSFASAVIRGHPAHRY